MKKLICLLLVLSTLVLTVSCGTGEPNADTTPSDATTVSPDTTTTVSPSGGTTASPGTSGTTTTAPAETTAKPEPQEKTVELSNLGFTPVAMRNTNSDVASATMGADGKVNIVSLAAGTTELWIENNYSEHATLCVTVDEKLNIQTELKPLEAPKHSVNIMDFGAKGNGTDNDTAALQAAMDSLTEGGTVYIPAGTYPLSGYIIFRENVHLRLEGNLPDATIGYTDEAAAWMNSGNIAILRGGSFLNADPGQYVYDGCSGFSVSGGAYISGGFTLLCADNVVFENFILKDTGGHPFQLNACSNLSIRNVMLAGWTLPSSRQDVRVETIQLEGTSPLSLNAASPEDSIVKCDDGYFLEHKNISITNCYFGKSDVSGPHMVPLGHHSISDDATVDGLIFSGNVVDNPMMYGLRLVNFINVEICNNKFISTAKSEFPEGFDYDGGETQKAFIRLYSGTGLGKHHSYIDKNGVRIIAAHDNEWEANRNYKIQGNDFVLGGGTDLYVLFMDGQKLIKPGAVVASDITRVDEWGGTPYQYSGYIASKNAIENIDFSGNSIEVKSALAYDSYLVRGLYIYRFNYENNTVKANGFVKNETSLTQVTGTDECTRVIKADATAGKIIFVTKDGEVEYKCLANGVLTLKAEGGRMIDVTVEKGNVYVKVDNLDDFEGWFDGESAVDFSSGFSESKTLTAKFKG